MSEPIPPSPQVILLNRALAYNVPGKVTGMSGAEYGISFYEETHAAHVCRMSLEEWRSCRQDVTNGGLRRASQWEVDFEFPPSPPAATAVPAPPPQPPAGPADDQQSAAPVASHTAESLAGVTNYRRLLGLAKQAGVENAEAIESTPALREAILEKQQGRLQPA